MQGLRSILSTDERADIRVHAHWIIALNQYDRINLTIPSDSSTQGTIGLSSFMSSPQQTTYFPLRSECSSEAETSPRVVSKKVNNNKNSKSMKSHTLTKYREESPHPWCGANTHVENLFGRKQLWPTLLSHTPQGSNQQNTVMIHLPYASFWLSNK